jgi:hypothetical protein
MNKKILKTLIKECYKEVLAENDSAITKPLDDKIQKDPNFLKQLQAATAAAEKGDTTDLALMMSGIMKENEEMDLPADTGKNINMGFDNNVGLATNKKISSRISMLQSRINDLSKQLETNLKMYKAGQMSIADYKKVAAHIPGQLKQLASDLETEMVKVSKI